MRKKDSEIRTTIESMLENGSSGQHLKNYFGGLPDKKLRRAISILSRIYPDKTRISDDDFFFVLYMFSDIKFMIQESFSDFVFAVNILDFTEPQKKLLTGLIQKNIEILSDNGILGLDDLLVSLFQPKELFQYLEVLAAGGSARVLQLVFDVLQHKDFSNSCISDEKIEGLKQKIKTALCRTQTRKNVQIIVQN